MTLQLDCKKAVPYMPKFPQILVLLLGVLSLGTRARIGRYLGFIFSIWRTRDRKIASLQMSTFLGSKASIANISGVYKSIGETLLEAINLKPILDKYQHYVDADWAQMDEILSRGKPIIILSAHTGNWELLAACSVKRGYKVSVVGKEAQNANFQKILRGIRKRYGVQTIWKSGGSAVQEIIQALKANESVAALIDQDTKVTSVMVDFFGRPASCPATLINIGKEYGAVFIAPLIFRTRSNHYKIDLTELDSSKSTTEILTQFNQLLEKAIRLNPAQWVWFHKRWRTLAGGQRLSSSDYVASLEQVQVSN